MWGECAKYRCEIRRHIIRKVTRRIAPRHNAVDGQGTSRPGIGQGNDEALANVGHGLKGYVDAGGAQAADLCVVAALEPLEMAGLRKWDPSKPGARLTDLGRMLFRDRAADHEATYGDPSWRTIRGGAALVGAGPPRARDDAPFRPTAFGKPVRRGGGAWQEGPAATPPWAGARRRPFSPSSLSTHPHGGR
jgi:hypothetical protein